MKKKIAIVLCILGIFLFCPGIILSLCHQKLKETESEKVIEEEERAGDSQEEQPEITHSEQILLEQVPPVQKMEVIPERVLLSKPTAELNGIEGVMSYRWESDCIPINDTTILLSCDCYFPEEELQQKIFYLAEAPDFEMKEIFRQDSRKGQRSGSGDFPELLERRIVYPLPVQAGYMYELDGTLYCLSKDFKESAFICNIREFMGELYEFSPWVADKNQCDVTADMSRLLACTDEGLYEYDLTNGEKKLLEPSVFLPYEIVHIEGDCDCGETGFDFSGPIEAEYTPDDQGYAFLTGTEYGNPDSIVLRSASGETLYQKELKGSGGFKWINSEDGDFLAAFYWEDGSIWMDQVDINTGEKVVFAVPDEVFEGTELCVEFMDADSLIYCKHYRSAHYERDYGKTSEYEIYRLSDGEQVKLEVEAEKINWKIRMLKLGSYESIIIKYPEV